MTIIPLGVCTAEDCVVVWHLHTTMSSRRCHRSRSSSASSHSSNRSDSKKKYKQKSRPQSPFDNVYLDDSDWLPSSTSDWDDLCLEKLGIFYYNEYHSSPLDILDVINAKTQCFGPMTEEQTQYVHDLINTLTFSVSMQDCKEHEQDLDNRYLTDVILPQLENQLLTLRQHFSMGKRVKSIPEEFLHVVIHVLRYELGRFKSIKRMGPATEDLYVTAFNLFARMCGVDTVPGSLWQTKMEVGRHDVTSSADLLIMPLESPESFRKDYPDADSVAVISVVEVNKLSAKKVQDELRYSSSIYEDVSSQTLGQHGGALLLHLQNYAEKLIRKRRILPGMIVIGTEVIFTVLEIDLKHLSQVYSMDPVNSRATIYYSKPKDFLKKEDRDVLLEAIIRLNNV